MEENSKEKNIQQEDIEKATEAQTTNEAEEATEEKNEEPTDAQKLEVANNEIAQLKDKYLRQVAEFDNYRKRTLKEKTELILNGGEKVLTALLPILDDLDRAAKDMEKNDDLATLKEGISLIINKLQKTLTAQGLQKMETVEKEFDTDYHEAIALIPAQSEEQKNHIIDCVQPGYLLNEKVIRHAKVVVAQ